MSGIKTGIPKAKPTPRTQKKSVSQSPPKPAQGGTKNSADGASVSPEAQGLKRAQVSSKNGHATGVAAAATARTRSLGFGLNQAQGSGAELQVKAKDGGDSVEGSVRGPASLDIQGGNGNDRLRATNVQGNLTLNGGAGDDQLLVGTAGPGTSTHISGGDGTDLAMVNIRQSNSTVMRGDEHLFGPKKGDSTINLGTDIEKILIMQNDRPAAQWPPVQK